ncbi:unnamed protein product [Absidia cylindrospora]
MPNNLQQEAGKTFTAEKIYNLRLKRMGIEQASKDLETKKRRSKRVPPPLLKKRKVANDSISIAGLSGTLGSNLLRLGDSNWKTAQEKYSTYISKNLNDNGLDVSGTSQLDLLGRSRKDSLHIKSTLESQYSYGKVGGGVENILVDDLNEYSKWTRKVKNKNTLTRCYNEILKLNPGDDKRGFKDIYLYM